MNTVRDVLPSRSPDVLTRGGRRRVRRTLALLAGLTLSPLLVLAPAATATTADGADRHAAADAVAVLPPPVVGASVCHQSSSSGYHCGTITAVNQSVVLPEGVVTGLFVANTCSEPGDYGAPAYSDDQLIGHVFLSSGNCQTGGVTYYDPSPPPAGR